MLDPKVTSFIKVYETGNFTKAAEQLSLTQPAVSKHIRMLENELGFKLFVRASNSLRLTREGKVVIKYAQRMTACAQSLQEELENLKLQISSLSVGITHTAESNASAEALAHYVKNHDNTKVKIITGSMDILCTMLKNYQLDAAIIEGRISDPTLRSLIMDTDCLMLAVSPTHPLAQKASVSIEELKREGLILRSSQSGTRTMFVSSLESQNMHLNEFNILMEIDNIATIKDLIRRNFGVSVLARSTCLDDYNKKKIALLPIEGLSMIREINLVYHHTFEHVEVLQDIIRSYNEIISRPNIK